MANLMHELWEEGELSTFCLAGPMGDGARDLLGPGAILLWTVVAESHFDAMTKYYEFKNWGEYTTEHELDRQAYSEEWLEIQSSRKPH